MPRPLMPHDTSTPFVQTNTGKLLGRHWALFFLLGMMVIFAFTGPGFFEVVNFQNIIHLATISILLAVAETFVIITGGIDLSCGTIMMASTIIGGTAYKTWGWPMWLSLLLILLVSTSFGLFNGILVSRLKLPPFIATLGTMMISLG
ncbi:MAG: hypothetical protein VB025_12700, partial [Sphaerochaeta sp.]|nr:hypothetical protein [Sphaerochaeta sp.]